MALYLVSYDVTARDPSIIYEKLKVVLDGLGAVTILKSQWLIEDKVFNLHEVFDLLMDNLTLPERDSLRLLVTELFKESCRSHGLLNETDLNNL